MKSINQSIKKELFCGLSGKNKEDYENNLDNKIVPELYNAIKTINTNREDTDIQQLIKVILEQTNEKKKIIKSVLHNYSIKIEEKGDEDGISPIKNVIYNYYVYFMQMIGNNIRSSGEYDDNTCIPGNETIVAERIDCLIAAIKKSDKKNNGKETRICIDALRNSVEILYFRDRYRAFYVFAVNTENSDRLLSSSEVLL